MWDLSVNGGMKQTKYGNYLVREITNCYNGEFLIPREYWVINLAFCGMIMLQTSNLRSAVKAAKTLNKS